MAQKTIFHIDLDAFFASVEQNDYPEYRNKPVVVGASPGRRGVVSACSYEAREYGVHSAMPISRAVKHCPHAVFLPVRMRRYQEVSLHIMELFTHYTPVVQQISVDEAFLDMTGTTRIFGPPEQAAVKIKKDIFEKTGLTVSIGIAPNHFLAKIASGYGKPDGLYIIEPGKEEYFLDSLPLDKLWGVGKKTLARLEDLNITTVKGLRRFSRQLLESMLGNAAGNYLYNIVRGIDPGIFNERVKNKSVSNETTFEEDTRDKELLSLTLLDLAHHVMFRLLKHGFRGYTVVLKLRYEDFSSTTIQKTLSSPVYSADQLHAKALELLRKRWDTSKPIRLIGIGVTGVDKSGGGAQQELFEGEDRRKQKLEEAVLSIKNQFDSGVIKKASLMKKKGENKKERKE